MGKRPSLRIVQPTTTDQDRREAARLQRLGYAAHRARDGARARACFEQSLAIWRGLGSADRVLELVGALAHLAQAYGREGAARAHLAELLRLARAAPSIHERGIAAWLIGWAELAASSHPARAARLLGAAEALIERAGGALTELCAPAFASAASTVHDQIDRTSLAAAWGAGRAMGAEEAVAWAQSTAVAT